MIKSSNQQLTSSLVVIFFFSFIFLNCCIYLQAQVAPASAGKIVPIIYPPLTERENKGFSLPQPPATHPRLFLTSKNIPALKEKAAHPLVKTCWDKIVNASGYVTNGYLPGNHEKYNNDIRVRDAIEARALMYAIYGDEKKGREVVESALHYLETLVIDMAKPDVTREIGRAILTGSLVYDWCYGLISAEEKKELMGRMETLATRMEIEWPAIRSSSITSHTVEAQLSRDMLSLAIACYNENPEIYKRVAGRIFAEFVPARLFYYPAGYHHQGSAYGAYRFTWELYTTHIFGKMGYPEIYGRDQAKVPYYFIYHRRPDGQMMRDGDDYTEQYTPFGKWWSLGQSAAMLAGSYYRDAIVLQGALKEKGIGDGADYIFDFLLFDPRAVGIATKASLPLTRYFQDPLGAMVARTGWNDGIASPDAIAVMKVQVYNFSNHQHLDAGSFQLYYKGPLTVQSGIYQGTTGSYGGEHFKNYSQRSIAHNTMLVYDPGEKFTWHGRPIINDGGQPYPNNAHEPENMKELLEQGYKTGEVLAHAFGPDSIKPDFSYLKGELAEAYPGKVKSFKRSFVFLNMDNTAMPGTLIVYDHITAADKNFKKYWLLHCVEKPFVDSIHTTIERTEKGYSGKMINTTLLPVKEDLVITQTGGKDSAYHVFGQNFPQSMVDSAGNSGDSAVWRITVSPKTASATNTFLNVMQVMDRGIQPPPGALPEKIETTWLTGARIGDRIVLFSKSGEQTKELIRLRINGKGTFRVLITDLVKGNWQVTCTDHKGQSPGIILNDQQLLYFTAAGGNYIIKRMHTSIK